MSSQQGQVIFNGRYELHHRLGRGGMAEVYLARDQLLDRPVAVKVLFPALATEAGFVERFRREAQSAANLQHPNIVSVFDWGEANGTYFIVMEYVEGHTLADTMRAEGRLHPDRAAEVVSDIAAALGFAHRNGVVHRDVKPGNVLITPDGAVKVADFGIARALSDTSDQNLTKTGSVMGTATYFSPEQARGAVVDPRSDLYSLGCVLYELTTGRPPFQGESAMAIAYKHVQENPVPPRQLDPELPETLEAITLKCLAKNPDNRYPTAADLRADLRRYLDGARILAEPVLVPPVDPGATGLMAPTAYGAALPDQGYDEGYYDDGYDDYYDEPEEQKRGKGFLVALILLLLVLAGVLFFLATSFGDKGEDVNQVTVPGVLDKTKDEATSILEGAKFKVETATEQSEKPVDTVIAQDPEPGVDADEGSTVTITLSAGPESIPVPNVVGKTAQEANDTLTAAGFLVQAEDVEVDGVEEGRVAEQNPAADAPAAKGSTVTIKVSSGPGQVTIPDVAGQDPGTATNTLVDAGLTPTRGDEASDTVPAGTVIRTDPPAGTPVDKGASVTVIVSSGADKVGVPNVENLDEDAAKSQLEAAGFQVNVTENMTNDPTLDGKVTSQTPTAGSQADAGSVVNIVVNRWRQSEITITTPTTEPGPGGGGN
jgi:beta-lactam-binding protein with PASTA domain/predicted Ser/Thr protein kinase